MRIALATLACALILGPAVCSAQPDYQRHATPITPAPVDPAIARALKTIQPAHIEQTIKTLVGFGTRNTMTSMDAKLPPGKGINAAADWIYGQFEAISRQCGGCLEVKRDVFIADPASGEPWARRILKPTKLTNIYAILRGTDPAEAGRMVLVTGHYDSIDSQVFKSWADTSGAAPGANDDGSGVAVSLECARALSKLKPLSTVVFVAVAGEEEGLVGSEHLAKLARSKGWDLEAVLNNDIVGGNTTPGDTLQLKDRVRVFSEGIPLAATPQQIRRIRGLGLENDSASRELARAIHGVARTYFPQAGPKEFKAFLVDRPDRYLRGGDHLSFNREGFAAVRFTEWREDYNHQHQDVVFPPAGSNEPIKGDLPRFVDYRYVARVARLNAATLATLAMGPGEPQHLAIVTKKLEDGTTLTWEPPAGAPAGTHYEVVWRVTTAPEWQYMRRVDSNGPGAAVTVTLPISKDNVYFGVRAVDTKGHRGLVVVP
ncbi:MAG TPA: M20/M25/M40 family metallo-hydrolase [Terracidiphilus sp.]|nr:M20/M25/M40 family metallo-hydrolase [Terracidiphilus sp.]